MNTLEGNQINNSKSGHRHDQRGSALIIALFIMALLGVFVALAMTRTASEAAALGNETSEGRTFYAAQGSLEMMTRNFNKVFEVRLNPFDTDLDTVRNGDVPGMAPQFTFGQEVVITSPAETKVISGGPYSGLYAIRDTWRLRTTATDAATGTQVRLTRNILNNRIPIFQFGVFYEDDLELYRPPLFAFGGRVHSNGHFFISPGNDGIYFDSRVTAVGHVVTQSWRNGNTSDMTNSQTFIKNASGVNRQLLPTMGSVLNGTPNVFGSGDWANPDMPESALNSNFGTQTAIFDGNLLAGVKPLKLPLKVGNDAADLVEMLRRGKKASVSGNGGDLAWNGTAIVPVTAPANPTNTASEDSEITRAERFANKTGIRISLSDSKAKLPGCSSGTGTTAVSTPCGVRLDGNYLGNHEGALPSPTPSATPDRNRGYRPVAMLGTDGYQTTRVNGERLNAGSGLSREVWIKVETVATNETNGEIITTDITVDFLSLGLTDVPDAAWGNNNLLYDCPTASPAPSGDRVPSSRICILGYRGTFANNGFPTAPSTNLTATTTQTPSTYPDSRSIIKLQRFVIDGSQIQNNNTLVRYSTNLGSNVVVRYTGVDTATKATNGCTSGCTTADGDPNSAAAERFGHLLRAVVSGQTNPAIVAFPIKMFDMREGNYYDRALTNPTSSPTIESLYPSANFGTLSTTTTDQRVAANGVMSLVDIDMANLRRFLRGDFDGRFPNGLRSSDIPQKEGWLIYVSDRRGDHDFDGEFDMEDVYGQANGNSPSLQLGEDANANGSLDMRACASSTDSSCEAELYRTRTLFPDQAAVNDHKYYRRGVRLINATVLPGIYNPAGGNGCIISTSAAPDGICGLTVASENGVYVKGNYNATHVTSVSSTSNTPAIDYRPLDSATHIPAAIIADGVTILSNAWNDGKSFKYPYELGQREAGKHPDDTTTSTHTTIRFAMIAGDTISSKEAIPHQGGISPRLNGGVHNFKRFLERWTNPGDSTWRRNLNYSGSLINLYNSRNANGSFKCCNTVYNPPVRNWVFDSTFLDPTRLPPGTPYFQYVQTTGFERTNN